MNKNISVNFLNDDKLLNHLMDHSEYIKYLNRNPLYFKYFKNDMKVIYKERLSDKADNVLDSIDLISDLIDTIK